MVQFEKQSASAAADGHLLQLAGIGKSFAGIPALNQVDLEVKGGEIHALLGANGAGKSTLMKIVSGAYTADSGTIAIDGRLIQLRSPAEAKAAGIHCVYQEVDTALIPQLTVAENIMLDRLASAKGARWLSWGKLYMEAEQVLARLGLAIPVRKKVVDLTLAEKQLVLLSRLLVERAKFVILDEPTAPLTADRTEAAGCRESDARQEL